MQPSKKVIDINIAVELYVSMPNLHQIGIDICLHKFYVDTNSVLELFIFRQFIKSLLKSRVVSIKVN